MDNKIKWTEASDEVKNFCLEKQNEITNMENTYVESENKKIWKFTLNKKDISIFEQFFDMGYFRN